MVPFSRTTNSTSTTADPITKIPGNGDRSGVVLPRRFEKFTAIVLLSRQLANRYQAVGQLRPDPHRNIIDQIENSAVQGPVITAYIIEQKLIDLQVLSLDEQFQRRVRVIGHVVGMD